MKKLIQELVQQYTRKKLYQLHNTYTFRPKIKRIKVQDK